MLLLKNIRINNNVAEADYYPEGENRCAHIVVDTDKWEILQDNPIPGYGMMYSGHALGTLVKMTMEKSKDTERVVKWF